MIRKRRQSGESESGFTLLELVVAVTLVALIAVGLWAVLQVSIRSWSRGTEYVDANQRHRSIMDLVRKQMASTCALYTRAEPLQGEVPYLVFSGTQTNLRFISLNSLRFHESPGLTVVSYEIVQDSNGSYALVEREHPYLGYLPDEMSMEESEATPVFADLSSCLFEYYDSGDDRNPARWVTEWNGQDLGRLPAAVSLTMVSRTPTGTDLSRNIVVPVKTESNLRANMLNPFDMRGRGGRGGRGARGGRDVRRGRQ
ncbi:MAG: prepilin-type N-terminal cleavage/methylation domain-containing protein [Acidobacteria bacterium]|nr:prepilin-type N-terminal cleavage/methylation domain-containing protein [Acidobacteriota bacterium]